MSNTAKEGKRRWRIPKNRPMSAAMSKLQHKRLWGRSEKIRRKWRQMWARLMSKARRQLDKEAEREPLV